MMDNPRKPSQQDEGLVSSPTQTPGVKRWPKGAWIAIGVLGIVLVATLSVTTTLLLTGHRDDDTASSAETTQRSEPNVEATDPISEPVVEQTPETPPEVGPALIPIGGPIVSPNYSLVIDSVEILDQIDTVSGVPIVAPTGTKLVLVHSTITVTGNAQDLTCGSDLFMQARDSQGAEMAQIFEGPEIPGNPECNYKTSAGETTSWNFAFKLGADRTPGELEVTDTNVDGQNNWGETLVAALS